MTTAVYTGSFDPLHDGHMSIVEQAARQFDRVVVAVLSNPEKVHGMFSISDRVELIQATVQHLGNVEVMHHSGMAVEVAEATSGDFFIRSCHKENHHELSMALMNEEISAVPTVFLVADAATGWVSSSFVRLAATSGRLDEACNVVPPAVAAAIRSRAST